MLLKEFIKEKKIKAEFLMLDSPFPTTKHAARYLSVKSGQILRAQLLQGENKRMVVCIIPGDITIDFKKVETLTGIRRLRFADTEAIFKATGFHPPSIPPFGYHSEIPVLIEKDILDYDYGFTLAGDIHLYMKIKPQEIVRVTDGSMVDITVRDEEYDDDEDENENENEDEYFDEFDEEET